MLSITQVHLINEGIIIFLLLLVELGIRYLQRRQKFEFNSLKFSIKSARDLESLTLEHNKKNQFLGIVRLCAVIVTIFLSILLYDIQAFSFFLIGVGAVVVVMRESVSSLIAYFYILIVFDVGDDIKIGESLGEIGKISPLYTSLIGKEENGEYNGKLILVPNYLFLQQRAEKQELKTTNYRRTSILWTLNREHSNASFPEVVQNVRAFLDELLPVRNVEEIGFFRNYAGRRYRLGLDFNTQGFPTVRVAFIAHPDDSSALREKVIAFLEATNAPPHK